MKNKILSIFALSIVLASSVACAVNRAVTINVGSIGGTLDKSAVRVVRQVVGAAVANGTVGKYEVEVLPLGAPFPIEGGFTACAEAGYKVADGRFQAFVQDLRSIRPRTGTFYNVSLTKACNTGAPSPLCESCGPIEPVVCPQDAQICPDGSSVGRVAPSCKFAPCPAVK